MAKKKDSVEDINMGELQSAIDLLNKKYGSGTLFVGQQKIKIPTYKTGLLALDYASNNGGFPKGRLIEVYGPESSGKTYVAFKNIAECQSRGEICVFLDVEQTFDPVWASTCGVDVDKLIKGQPSTVEDVVDIIEKLSNSRAVSLIVVDSVAAMQAKEEEEADEVKAGYPAMAKVFSPALRRLVPILAANKTNVIFINHLMEDIGKFGYGSKKTTPGGKKLKYYSSIRVECAKVKTYKDKDNKVIGCRTSLTVVKNKMATPYGKAEFDFYAGSGENRVLSYLEFAEKFGIIKVVGRKYAFGQDTFSADEASEYFKTESGLKVINMVDDKVYNANGETIDEQTNSEEISKEGSEETDN